jgi:hypothetical protein
MTRDARMPWIKFRLGDWSTDPALQSRSIAARGLWIEMLCLATQGQPYGHVSIKVGEPMAVARIAVACRVPVAEREALLQERGEASNGDHSCRV